MKYTMATRILPYPYIEEGNQSYTNATYKATPQVGPTGNAVTITHTLTNAPFIQKLLAEGIAQYACLVSVPKTAYRKIETSSHAIQTLHWPQEIVSEPPLLRPMIVTVQERVHKFTDTDGVEPIWTTGNVTFPKGARLACVPYMRPSASMQNLIDISEDAELAPGNFTVSPVDQDGFYFRIKAAPKLFAFLKNPHSEYKRHHASIVTHIVHACLECLVAKYGQDTSDDEDGVPNWGSNLIALERMLQEKGLMSWRDEGFSAAEVAMALHPHQPPDSESTP